MIEFNEQDFLNTYRGMVRFVTDESEYYNLFLKLLQDDELLRNIKFANDVFGIPPIKTFIIYERDYLKKDVFNKEMSAIAKRGLGACFGYLYKFIYKGYDSEQSWFNDCDENKQKTGIKTASYFIKRG
ncbi:MAG: hypothetical protein K2G31_04395 [Clostridia bacterium]|nr:hypothetical protein [Clostridia bacterium]